MKSVVTLKGRGAQEKVANHFEKYHHQERDDFKELRFRESGSLQPPKTQFTNTYPKTIVNKVNSPDVGMRYSLNPYQGCEHGCVYCYARNSHQYWGYGPGLDFEQQILVKANAVSLLAKKLKTPSWKAVPIVLSGNTDCYQPIERELKITRSLLEVFLKYKHPVGIITKNALIQRDIDLLSLLAKDRLVHVYLSVTTLQEELCQAIEPRTATIRKRLETIEKLSQAGIPVGVMMAPVIPGLNSHEVMNVVKAVSERGALKVGSTIVRLNGAVGGIFEKWICTAFPDKADKVLHQITACHGGTLNDSQFGRRMKGTGPIASQIHQQFAIAKRKYLVDKKMPELNCDLHLTAKSDQLFLF